MRSGAELDIAPPLELERMTGGELVAIRSVEADDGPLLRELLTDYVRARRHGLHRGWMGVSHRVPRSLQPLADPAQLEEALLAIEPHTGRALGMAALRRGTDGNTATPWMLVRDGFRHRGLGTALLERLAQRAWSHHCDRFRVRAVVSEQRMLEMMRGVGVESRSAGSLREVDAEVPLQGEGLGVALGAALWAVARGGLVPMLPTA